jgi:hypothetical protein
VRDPTSPKKQKSNEFSAHEIAGGTRTTLEVKANMAEIAANKKKTAAPVTGRAFMMTLAQFVY